MAACAAPAGFVVGASDVDPARAGAPAGAGVEPVASIREAADGAAVDPLRPAGTPSGELVGRSSGGVRPIRQDDAVPAERPPTPPDPGTSGAGHRSRPDRRPPAVLRLRGPARPSAAPVVAVPGLGLSVDVPARTLRLLQPVVGSAVVALPGFGLPGARGAATDPAALAVRLLEQLDTAHVREAVLLGHSASCQVVVDAAVRDPARVVGLVLVGPTTDPRAAGWPTLAVRWLRTATRERPGQVPVLLRDYHRTGLVDMARTMDAARRHRIDHLVAGVACPVLVVRGRHDRIAPADWVASLAALAPRGRAVTLPAGAHMVPITHPSALAARIEAFHPGGARRSRSDPA